MITEEHLRHWLSQMEWEMNGLLKELNKKSFADEKIVRINGDVFSFEYAREKADKLAHFIRSTIPYDIDHDGEKIATD